MATARLPTRVRLAVGVVVAALVVAVVGGGVAIQYGAGAVQASAGGELSAAAADSAWFGIEIRNDSALPATLHAVRLVSGSNARIADYRALDRHQAGAQGIGVLSPPLPAQLQDALDSIAPFDGFPLPAGSGDRYQVAVLVERIDPERAAVVRGLDVTYSVLGLDHGARSDSVLRIRTP